MNPRVKKHAYVREKDRDYEEEERIHSFCCCRRWKTTTATGIIIITDPLSEFH